VNREHSVRAFQRARQLIPGGVNSPARAFGAVGGSPLFIQRAEAQYLFDIDGNRYIDYIGSWGPMILGHAHPQVIDAICQAASRGTSFGAPTEMESHLAELIIAAVPSMERVRLVSSGTEATMSAIRVARGVTGRDKVIKFSGCYHGHVDSLLVAAGSAAATLGVPDSPGVTLGTSQDTIVLNYNDCDGVLRVFNEQPNAIAAVILEPVVGNMGTVLPTQPFLRTLRELTHKHNSVLIFDEVMTGFRVAYGGAQAVWGIEPDMTTLGKIVGGGMPLAAYGGRASIMDNVMPAGKVYQAGTLSGNPLATAAGAKTLELLRDEPPYEYLETISAQLPSRCRCRDPHSTPKSGQHDDPFLQRNSCVGLAFCRPIRSQTIRGILLEPDGPKCLHAMQSIRSVVRKCQTHLRRHPPYHRCRAIALLFHAQPLAQTQSSALCG
jgi:glutamate-1-semialdehyde 2,1-aminomutase